MSLRTRLAIGMALLAAAAALIATGIAYATTAGRLSAEVDQSLRQGAARISSMPAMGTLPGPGRPVTPPMNTSQGPLGILGLVAIQYLSPVGDVVTTGGQVALPVTAADKRLARSGGTPWLHDSTVAGVPYRVLTQPLHSGGAVQLARDESENQAVLGSLRWRYGLLDAAVVAAAALAGWIFASGLLQPLRRLAGAADQVAATGRLDIPIHAPASDETGRLARAFATMLGALSRSRAQQQQLAQDAAHELRTPLTSLRANVDILRRHDTLPAQARTRILGALDTELRELSALVDDLVELSTDPRHGRDQPEAQPVRLDQVTEMAVQRARQRTGRTITLHTQPCLVHGQPRALASAIANLIDNAVKFSPEHTTIDVTVRAGHAEVHDHGPGIAPEDLPHIFDRFYRSAGARSHPGSGLGLAIVAHVAETHGGRTYACNDPTGGAVLGIELPAETSAPTSETHGSVVRKDTGSSGTTAAASE